VEQHAGIYVQMCVRCNYLLSGAALLVWNGMQAFLCVDADMAHF